MSDIDLKRASIKIQYCSQCVLPSTRPGIVIKNDGLCNACHNHSKKDKKINWHDREKVFREFVDEAKSRNAQYDCVIPVSGGKDSTWQIIKCKEYGLKILALTWKTPGRNELGQKNLDNLISLGVDHLDISINPEVERKFMLKSLQQKGSTAVPMHLAIYGLPVQYAMKLDIPLIIWGENPHMEYGSIQEEKEASQLNAAWLNRHDILQGTEAKDWADESLTAEDLAVYTIPDEEEMSRKQIKSIFLGSFFYWDPFKTAEVALRHGFQVRESGPKVGFYQYADIDCDFISVHHYFKWLKFGFTRLFDNLSLEIRNQRMTRSEALEIIRKTGDQRPHEDIQKVCEFMRISEAEFRDIEEKFRNRQFWIQKNGKWQIEGFIISDWEW